MGGFVVFAVIAHKYGQRDLFAKLNQGATDLAPSRSRSGVSRLLDEITCAFLGAPEKTYRPGIFDPTVQQVVYVLGPIVTLTMAIRLLLDTGYDFFWALALYAALVAAIAVLERVIEGPGTFTRQRTPGSLGPVARLIFVLTQVVFVLWFLVDWLRGLSAST